MAKSKKSMSQSTQGSRNMSKPQKELSQSSQGLRTITKSQRGLTQSSQDVEDISELLVHEAVKVILVLDATKRPIKQSDVVSYLSDKPKRKQLNLLWNKVMEDLDGLGMSLCEVTPSNCKAFILVSKEPELQFMHKFLIKEERAERTLLVLVLSYIFMKDGKTSEDELFRHLTNLRILDVSGNGKHDYFGDVKKLVTGQFVDQLYLQRTIVAGQDGSEFEWGIRARLEVPMEGILEFVCKAGYGGRMQPKNWVSHYEKICKESAAEEDNCE